MPALPRNDVHARDWRRQATSLEIDAEGKTCGITIEHANERTEISCFSFEQVPA